QVRWTVNELPKRPLGTRNASRPVIAPGSGIWMNHGTLSFVSPVTRQWFTSLQDVSASDVPRVHDVLLWPRITPFISAGPGPSRPSRRFGVDASRHCETVPRTSIGADRRIGFDHVQLSSARGGTCEGSAVWWLLPSLSMMPSTAS